MSWRNHLKIHPACELFPPMSDEELKVLADDIRKHGMKSPIVLWHDGNEVVLIAGRNRLDAVERFAPGFANGPIIKDGGITWDVKYLSVSAWLPNNGGAQKIDPYAYVASANLHRRHLTAEQRIELVEKVIKSNPQMSSRRAAKIAGVSPTTATKAREKLEKAGDVSTVDTSIDTKGRQQPVHKSQTASPDKPKPKPISSPPIVPSANPAKSSKPSVNTAPPLNSLSWSDATPDSRREFIDAVGVVSLWEAMTEEQQTQLIDHINALQDAADAAKTKNAHCS
jgi:hypothetical protein